MRLVSREEILEEKINRRKKIKELKQSCNGDLVHVGTVSTGCTTCFYRKPNDNYAIYVGTECNVKCPECYYDPNRNDQSWKNEEFVARNFAGLYERIADSYFDLKTISYNSHGEPLLYMNALVEAGKLVLKYQNSRGKKVFSHLYTNGMLATKENLEILKQIEVTELRFHVSASNWNKDVLNSMRTAKEMGFRVTVEESSLPEKKEKLLEHLEIFEDIGILHLDLVECQVTSWNYKYLDSKYPNGRYYRDRLWHLYDEGMVYDIMEEVLKRGYKFSVIDCNSRNEVCRDGKQIEGLPDPNSLEDMYRKDKDKFMPFET